MSLNVDSNFLDVIGRCIDKGESFSILENGEITLNQGFARVVRWIPFVAAYQDKKTAQVYSKFLKQKRSELVDDAERTKFNDKALNITKCIVSKYLKPYRLISGLIVKNAILTLNKEAMALSLDIPVEVFNLYPDFSKFIYVNRLAGIISSMKHVGHEVKVDPETLEPSILVEGKYLRWTDLEKNVFIDKESKVFQWEYLVQGLQLHSRGDWRVLSPFKVEESNDKESDKYYFEIVTVESKYASALQQVANFDFGHAWMRLKAPSEGVENQHDVYSVGYFWNRERFLSPDIFEHVSRKQLVTKIEITKEEFKDVKSVIEYFQDCVRMSKEPENNELKTLFDQFKLGTCANFVHTILDTLRSLDDKKELILELEEDSSFISSFAKKDIKEQKDLKRPLTEVLKNYFSSYSSDFVKWATVICSGMRPGKLANWQISYNKEEKIKELVGRLSLKEQNDLDFLLASYTDNSSSTTKKEVRDIFFKLLTT
jgi:hypothetical protein